MTRDEAALLGAVAAGEADRLCWSALADLWEEEGLAAAAGVARRLAAKGSPRWPASCEWQGEKAWRWWNWAPEGGLPDRDDLPPEAWARLPLPLRAEGSCSKVARTERESLAALAAAMASLAEDGRRAR